MAIVVGIFFVWVFGAMGSAWLVDAVDTERKMPPFRAGAWIVFWPILGAVLLGRGLVLAAREAVREIRRLTR
jgi:hypothetical protein